MSLSRDIEEAPFVYSFTEPDSESTSAGMNSTPKTSVRAIAESSSMFTAVYFVDSVFRSSGAMMPLWSTTRILRSSLPDIVIIRAGATIIRSMNTGMRSVVTMKLFLWTRSINSRPMTIPILDFIIM